VCFSSRRHWFFLLIAAAAPIANPIILLNLAYLRYQQRNYTMVCMAVLYLILILLAANVGRYIA
jgi:hypothetical protein